MSNKEDLVIVSAVRTPFSKFGGTLKSIHSSDLGKIVIQEVLNRANIKGEDIDELYYGMCIQSEAALKYNVIGRQALLHAGMPADTISLTIDRACCSSLTTSVSSSQKPKELSISFFSFVMRFRSSEAYTCMWPRFSATVCNRQVICASTSCCASQRSATWRFGWPCR